MIIYREDKHADMHVQHQDCPQHHEYYWLDGAGENYCLIVSICPFNTPGVVVHSMPNLEAIAECKRLQTEGWREVSASPLWQGMARYVKAKE